MAHDHLTLQGFLDLVPDDAPRGGVVPVRPLAGWAGLALVRLGGQRATFDP
jgi:hypothetical protein